MKKFIISTIAAFFGLAMLASSAHAQAVFNSPGEMPTMTVSNSTRTICNYGPINGCWQPTTTAQPGDTIAVHIYYKNTSNTAAQSTTLSITPQSSGPTTGVSFYGGVASLSGPRAVGTATVSISSSQSLDYIPGSAVWYPSATSGTRPVDSSGLFGTSGFNIGTVNPGEQGVLVAFFKVSNFVIIPPPQIACSIDTFYASPTSVASGGYTTLYWNTTNCDNVTVDGVTYPVDGSGSFGPLYVGRNYELRATNNGASAQIRSVYVSVNQNNQSCDATFYSSNTSITSGSAAILNWSSYGLSSINITPNLGNQNTIGTATVYPTSTTTYTLTGYGCGNTISRYVTINVNGNQGGQPQAITTVASAIGQTSARLNGIAIPNSNYSYNYNNTAWFEWGISGSLGNRTTAQSVTNTNNSTYYSDSVSGLTPGTVYYYRAVVQSQSNIAYGDIVRFVTPQNTVIVTPPHVVNVVNQTNTVFARSTSSLLELRVDNTYDRMCLNGEMNYTVTYRNISGQTLQNTVLRITHPKELTFINSTRGNYEIVDRTVTISLGDVKPGEQGTVQVRARVNSTAVVGNLAVTTASVVYTNTVTRAQEEAIAYSLMTVSTDCPATGNNLGASAFGLGFLPSTLLGWLILILVILGLILIGRQIYKKKQP